MCKLSTALEIAKNGQWSTVEWRNKNIHFINEAFIIESRSHYRRKIKNSTLCQRWLRLQCLSRCLSWSFFLKSLLLVHLSFNYRLSWNLSNSSKYSTLSSAVFSSGKKFFHLFHYFGVVKPPLICGEALILFCEVEVSDVVLHSHINRQWSLNLGFLSLLYIVLYLVFIRLIRIFEPSEL